MIITIEYNCSYNYSSVDSYNILKNQKYITNEYGDKIILVIDYFYKTMYISSTSSKGIPNEEEIVKTIIELKKELKLKEDYKVLATDLNINKKLMEYMK